MVARRVEGDGAPAAADVEHPHPGPLVQPELAADELVLRLLGLLEVLDAGAKRAHEYVMVGPSTSA